MPEPSSAEYTKWFTDRAPTAYLLFLSTHPGFVISTIRDNINIVTINYLQPYFTPDSHYDQQKRATLLFIGSFLQPDTPVFFLIDTILLVSMIIGIIKSRDRFFVGWC